VSGRRCGQRSYAPGVIDLRSDTATKPTPEMLAAMTSAELGDEQAREDPTVNELQRRAAELLGQEAALFLPTATMANQIALRVLTRPGTQLIAEERTHILVYEAGGPAVHAGLVTRPLPGVAGRITPQHRHPRADAPERGRPRLATRRAAGGDRHFP
jgi:threonine aldolase